MPQDAPPSKLAATRGYQQDCAGSEVVLYDRFKEDREKICKRIAQERGMVIVPPYDHAHVMAGNGTAGLELIRQIGQDEPLDFLFVCTGGGGLLSGCATAANELAPHCKVIGVEPEAGDDTLQSLRAGKIVHIDTPNTIADGAQTQHTGELTFPVIQKRVTDIVTVTDEQLVHTMRFFAETMKIVVEPTGCLGAAAVLFNNNRFDLKGKRVGIIVSGGNVDMTNFCALLSKYPKK